MEKELDYVALGQRIRKSRIEKSITQEQLGEICELSTAHIGHIERGTRTPSIDSVFRISQALNVSMDYLIFDSIAPDESLIAILNSTIQHNDNMIYAEIYNHRTDSYEPLASAKVEITNNVADYIDAERQIIFKVSRVGVDNGMPVQLPTFVLKGAVQK